MSVIIWDLPDIMQILKDLEEENYETSLREIIAIFKRSKDREAMKQYYLEHKEQFKQLDEISIDTMGVLIGKFMCSGMIV